MAVITVYYSSSKNRAGDNAEPVISVLPPPGKEQAQPIGLEYINEGNANVIFRLTSLEDKDDFPDFLRNKLVRLRKGKSFIRPTVEQHAALRTHFTPLFEPGNLIEQDLVRIGPGLAEELNGLLQRLETSGVRPKSRHEDTLATDEPYGLLMTDMTAAPGGFQLELKPKWLVQSPDAPANAVRCRTCALRARRLAATHRNDSLPVNPSDFCPFGLLSSDVRERRKVFEAVAHKRNSLSSKSVQDAISTLSNQVLPVLTDLQKHQASLDRSGILNVEPEHIPENYLKAMTLRDCVLLIKGTATQDHQSHHVFEARLADLDLKHAHPEKVPKWKETEKALVEEGWYTNTERDAVPERVCLLSRLES